MENEITIRGKKVTREDVLSAIATCDSMGKKEFLNKYGYGESVRLHLRHSGRSYPSKAILGVAAGIDWNDFHGGARETVKFLTRLGFIVRNSETGEIAGSLGIDELRRQAIAAGFNDPAPEWDSLPIAPSAYFMSGSNRASEIRALGIVNADIGVVANEIRKDAEDELLKLAGSDVLVFVDSGAFSEVEFDPAAGGMVVVNPISGEEWIKRLALYKRLAIGLRDQVYLVAPDRIGSQEETLERLEIYREEVRELIDLGARVLVVMQKGELDQSEFAGRVDAILGTSNWIPSLPCKKAATTAEEVATFLSKRSPKHVHLLGLGVRNKSANAYLAPFAGSSSSVSLDSCWIRANVGQGRMKNGKRIGYRRFTKACDIGGRILAAAGQLTRALQVELAIALCLAAPLPADA